MSSDIPKERKAAGRVYTGNDCENGELYKLFSQYTNKLFSQFIFPSVRGWVTGNKRFYELRNPKENLIKTVYN